MDSYNAEFKVTLWDEGYMTAKNEENAKHVIKAKPPHYLSHNVIMCPSCNEVLQLYKIKYCYECGQKLIWED